MTQAAVAGRLGQIARTVGDIDVAIAFYRDSLGLPLLFRFEGMGFFDLAGTRLYLQQADTPAAESILYFAVDDIDAAHASMLSAGVTFERPPHRVHRHDDGTEEWMAFFMDPDNRPLALIARRHAH